ncbi:sorting nexin-16 isoform x1 [Nannochloropsis oceanica]
MEAIIVKQDEGQAGFVRYTILVTLRGQSWSIIRRFNDFIPLHNALCRSFPGFPGRLPVKKWFGRFNPDFLQDRKLQLQHYLDVVTRLPGFPESSHEGCLFFEIDGHMDGQGMDDLAQQDGGEIEDTTPSGEASISAILDDTSHAFINTSSPLHQAFIEQMDPVELAQQRNKLLQWTSGFRGPSSTHNNKKNSKKNNIDYHHHYHHHHKNNNNHKKKKKKKKKIMMMMKKNRRHHHRHCYHNKNKNDNDIIQAVEEEEVAGEDAAGEGRSIRWQLDRP